MSVATCQHVEGGGRRCALPDGHGGRHRRTGPTGERYSWDDAGNIDCLVPTLREMLARAPQPPAQGSDPKETP